MRIRLTRSQVTAGKSCLPKSYASITDTTTVWQPMQFVFIMSTVHWEPSRAVKRKHQQLYPEKWLWLAMGVKSRFGAMANRRDHLCTWMIASKGCFD